MSDSLPDEIISEILSPALKVPEHLFSDLSRTSPFAKYSVSTSSILLVCKSWLRVATPLLYNVVILRSKAQSRALHDALKLNPELGRFIRRLRVEGGFGNPLQLILKSSTNLTDIFLSLDIHSSDSTAGLVAGLPLINPARLLIFDFEDNRLRNKAVLQLRQALSNAIASKWTNLHTLLLPFAYFTGVAASYGPMIASSNSLKVVSFPHTLTRPTLLDELSTLAKLPTLEAIEIRNRPVKTPLKSKPYATQDDRLKSLLRWAKPYVREPIIPKRVYRLTVQPALDPTFQPMQSIPQDVSDAIWLRILRFAMLAPILKLINPPPGAQAKAEKADLARRAGYLQVSKTFYRLASPYLYRHIKIPERLLQPLAETIDASPALGKHISTIEVFRSWREGPLVGLTRILQHTSSLERVLLPVEMGRHLEWSAFLMLSEHSGATLRELSARVEAVGVGVGESRSPAVLEKFTALARMAWNTLQRTADPTRNIFSNRARAQAPSSPYFDLTQAISSAGLPALTFLILRASDMCPVLTKFDLPNLKRLSIRGSNTIRVYSSPPHVGEMELALFLNKHGSKLIGLATDSDSPLVNRASLLVFCPNITSFECKMDEKTCHLGTAPPAAPSTFQHAHIEKLEVKLAMWQPKAEKSWDAIISSKDFQDALTRLPALREIRIFEAVWPTVEREIAKSAYVKWAETLSARGIKVADKAGKEWHPRLKATGRSGVRGG
ncbi:hypothetical protein C8F01DRAFT_375368 [Mycena amicta]|nr:hypothetical protein C8F01DRAFT_375368 [Mycena amicta]